MEINLVELWNAMGTPVRVVVGILTLQAIASLAVVVDRLILLFRDASKSRALSRDIRSAVDAADWERALEVTTRQAPSYLGTLVDAGLRTFLERSDRGDEHAKAIELTRRAMERRNEKISADLNKGMSILASTGSTAPFVGLLGTVLGIIHAFHMIATSGSGGIGTIGASIGEALIVTGYGLCVAIPVVLLFNVLQGRIQVRELALQNAGGEILDRLEANDAMTEESADVRREIGEPMSAAPGTLQWR